MSGGQTFWYQWKGSIIKNTHIKYESPTNYHSRDMVNFKVFKKYVKLQSQGQVVKKFGTNKMVLS
jgi:hypothetical protein